MRLVAFDLDGTLVDSRVAIVGCFQHALSLHGLPAVPDEAIAARIGLPLARMLDGLAPADRVPDCIESYREHFHEWDRRTTRPFDGVIEAVRAVRSSGAAVWITSSKARVGIERVVREQGILGLFDGLLGGDQVQRGKPDPEMLERAMAAVGAAPEHTAIVGDTTFDIEMGVAAGARAVGVAWGMHGAERLFGSGAHAVAADPSELPVLVGAPAGV